MSPVTSNEARCCIAAHSCFVHVKRWDSLLGDLLVVANVGEATLYLLRVCDVGELVSKNKDLVASRHVATGRSYLVYIWLDVVAELEACVHPVNSI